MYSLPSLITNANVQQQYLRVSKEGISRTSSKPSDTRISDVFNSIKNMISESSNPSLKAVNTIESESKKLYLRYSTKVNSPLRKILRSFLVAIFTKKWVNAHLANQRAYTDFMKDLGALKKKLESEELITPGRPESQNPPKSEPKDPPEPEPKDPPKTEPIPPKPEPIPPKLEPKDPPSILPNEPNFTFNLFRERKINPLEIEVGKELFSEQDIGNAVGFSTNYGVSSRTIKETGLLSTFSQSIEKTVEEFKKNDGFQFTGLLVGGASDLTGKMLAGIFEIMSKSPNAKGIVLRELHEDYITFPANDIDENTLNSLIENLAQVQLTNSKIRVGFADITAKQVGELMVRYQHVTEWDLSACEKLDSDLLYVITSLPHLKKVILPDHIAPGILDLEQIPHTRRKVLLTADRSKESVEQLVIAMPGIKEEHLPFFFGILTHQPEFDLTSQMSLRILDLVNKVFKLDKEFDLKKILNEEISEAELLKLIFALPRLFNQLDLSDCTQLSHSFVNNLINLPTMKRIVLPKSFCKDLHKQESLLGQYCHGVVLTTDRKTKSDQSLVLVIPEDIDNNDLVAMHKLCPHIWKFDLADCTELTTELIHYFFNAGVPSQLKLPLNLKIGEYPIALLPMSSDPIQVKNLYCQSTSLQPHAMEKYTGRPEFAYLIQIPLARAGIKFTHPEDYYTLDAEAVFFWTFLSDYLNMPINPHMQRIFIDENKIDKFMDFRFKFPNAKEIHYNMNTLSIDSSIAEECYIVEDKSYFRYPNQFSLDEAASLKEHGVLTSFDHSKTLLYSGSQTGVRDDEIETIIFDSTLPANSDIKEFLEKFQNLKTVIYNGNFGDGIDAVKSDFPKITFEKKDEIVFKDETPLDQDFVKLHYEWAKKAGLSTQMRFYRTMIELFFPKILEEDEVIASDQFLPHIMNDVQMSVIGRDVHTMKHILACQSKKYRREFIDSREKNDVKIDFEEGELDSVIDKEVMHCFSDYLEGKSLAITPELASKILPFSASILEMAELSTMCWNVLCKEALTTADQRVLSALSLLAHKSYYAGAEQLQVALPQPDQQLLNTWDQIYQNQNMIRFPDLETVRVQFDEQGKFIS